MPTSSLIHLYSLYNSKEITLEEFANSLDITPHALKVRMGVAKHKLPLLLATLDKIAANEISRDEAAEVLGVKVRALNAISARWHVMRPLHQNAISEMTTQVKWEMRKKYAIDYIADGVTIEEAAELGQCSERQIRRWVSDLLMKHYEMTWKDLKELSSTRRKRLADDIAKNEKIDSETENALNAINRGQITMEEEVVGRILEKKRRPRPKPRNQSV